ncbi:hypothetical protein ACRYCC_01305 [Actinomadura scrupuli]|uniref:hypothetical protein n=1 Tax=Actinomadura scrupuli TaxID=559629 RepID=UPI003D979BC5
MSGRMESSEPDGTPGAEHVESAETAPFPQFTQPPQSPTPAPPSFGHAGPVQTPATAGDEAASLETPPFWDHPGDPAQRQDLGPVPGGFSAVSSPAAYPPPPGPSAPPSAPPAETFTETFAETAEPDGPASPAEDEPVVEAGSPGIPPALLERPKSPWWAEIPEDPDPVFPSAGPGHDATGRPDGAGDPDQPVAEAADGSTMGLEEAQDDDEAAARRTAYVVPPTPGTLVAGPGVPTVDTRRAVPPEPLVDRRRSHPDTKPDGLPVMGAPDATVTDTTGAVAGADAAGAARTRVDGPRVNWFRPGGAEGAPADEAKAHETAHETEADAAGSAASAPTAQDRPDVTRPEGFATAAFWAPPEGSGNGPDAGAETGSQADPESVPQSDPSESDPSRTGSETGSEAGSGTGSEQDASVTPEGAEEGAEEASQSAVGASAAETVTDAAAWNVAGQAQPGAAQQADGEPAGVSFQSLAGHGPVTVTMPVAEPSTDSPAPAPWPMMSGAFTSPTTSPGPHPVAAPPFGTGHDPSGPPPGILASAYQPPAWPPPEPDAPGGPASAGDTGAKGSGSAGRQRLLLVGGGVVGMALIAAVALLVISMSGPSAKKPVAQSAPSTAPPPSAAPSSPPARSPAAQPGPKAPSIDSEKTDPKALALTEVFPSAKLALGGRTYVQDRTSVNHRCALAARGAMAKALQQGRCSSVVRATYVDSTKKYAVTTGIAVLPTRVTAVTVSKAGDPSRYEWFRGLQGKVATKIDQAGGWAASTVRGRYIVYAYAQYADGTKPQPDDAALKALSRQFIGYAVRPINKRAQ